jgi:PTS system nitrogen regulatory IIA component
MDITTLLSPERIAYEPDVSSKKRAFECLATMLANTQGMLDVETIFDALTNREKLGSTALGNGIAIPHASLSITRPCGALLLLDEGVKMDAPDKKPVQLFMAILVPSSQASEFSQLITELASIFLAQKSLIDNIRQLHEPAAILTYLDDIFTPPEQRYGAALAA